MTSLVDWVSELDGLDNFLYVVSVPSLLLVLCMNCSEISLFKGKGTANA